MENNTVNIGIPINVDKLLTSRLLIQAGSGAGKSYLLRKTIESVGNIVQQIIIDPEGEFVTLREKFDFILVGNEGDIPLSLKYAETLAHKLLETNTSAILDLYELKHHERILFVKRFVDALMNAPKELWHPCLVYVDEAHMFCLSSDTELLTESGWKKYTEISIGDLAFAYNAETGQSSLQKIQNIIVRDFDGELNHLYNQDSIDCLATDDHRVLCSYRTSEKGRDGKNNKSKNKWSPVVFKQADRLPTGIKIPILSDVINNNENLIIDDDLLLILGWIITDGSKRKKDKVYEIYQSKVKGAIYERMVEIIKRRFPKTTISSRTKKGGLIKGRQINRTEATTFYLGSESSKEIKYWLSDACHEIPGIILERASQRQLQLLFDALIDGDGTISRKGNYIRCCLYCGFNLKLADQFQELCFKLGYSSSIYFSKSNGQTNVLVSYKRKWASVRKVKKVKYCGKVWDITIPFGAFIARRNGKVFITGNCPESSKSESMSSIIDLCTRGRKRGFAAILATQRLSKLHKDAAAECQNKMIGQTSLDIDRKRAGDELGMTNKADILKLRELHTGEFYGFGPAMTNDIVKFKVGKVVTTHIQAGKKMTAKPPTPAAIQKILSKLADIPQEAEKELATKQQLQKEVTRLRTELTKATKESGKTDELELSRLKQQIIDLEATQKRLEAIVGDQAKVIGQQRATIQFYGKMADKIRNEINIPAPDVEILKESQTRPLTITEMYFKKPVIINTPRGKGFSSNNKTSSQKEQMAGGKSLPIGERAILIACAQFPDGLRREQMTVITGYKRSSRDAYIQRLREKGFLIQAGDRFIPSEEGADELGENFEPLPTGGALQRYWIDTLPKGESAILVHLIEYHPDAVSRDRLTELTGYQRSSRDAYIQRMGAKEIVKITDKGMVRASDNLFD